MEDIKEYIAISGMGIKGSAVLTSYAKEFKEKIMKLVLFAMIPRIVLGEGYLLERIRFSTCKYQNN